ncbi:hypothetical protein F4775DRAFT_531001 [Biscogniauxia sp. FL1348]|nr:hypothetical protein F4775DRAFT_531001 [Biscogniauxia sp. FL1348]
MPAYSTRPYDIAFTLLQLLSTKYQIIICGDALYFSVISASDIYLHIEEDVYNFSQEELNGREIAKCVSSAMTLARFKGTKLAAEHVHMLLDTRREFDRSRNKTNP